MKSTRLLFATAGLIVAGGLFACTGTQRSQVTATSEAQLATQAAARPLSIEGPIFEFAGQQTLPPERPKIAESRMENLWRLSDRIISGGEPVDEASLKELADRGIKTILSVDGKVPDAATAERLGMRYVHVPIRYSEISDEEIAKIAKTFRELEGPFFVHCFHGKHRGPAAAAIGRVVLDGVSRERAVAEMRQWMGTSKSYDGLYRTVACAEIPDAAATSALEFGFDAAHAFTGFREIMVEMTRAFDHIGYLQETNYSKNPKHPDLVAAHEAETLRRLFEASLKDEEHLARPADFRRWMESSLEASRELEVILKQAGGRALEDTATADRLMDIIESDCIACHKVYRN